MVSQLMASSAGQLQFADAAGCKKWLETLPLTNVAGAQQTLLQQLGLLQASAIAPSELLRVLETLRDTLLPRLISGQLRIPEAETIIEEATV